MSTGDAFANSMCLTTGSEFGYLRHRASGQNSGVLPSDMPHWTLEAMDGNGMQPFLLKHAYVTDAGGQHAHQAYEKFQALTSAIEDEKQRAIEYELSLSIATTQEVQRAQAAEDALAQALVVEKNRVDWILQFISNQFSGASPPNSAQP